MIPPCPFMMYWQLSCSSSYTAIEIFFISECSLLHPCVRIASIAAPSSNTIILIIFFIKIMSFLLQFFLAL